MKIKAPRGHPGAGVRRAWLTAWRVQARFHPAAAIGVIGRPSLATAEKGKAVLASLVDSFASVLEVLQRG
jgi:creatinine amidohydrolase/Fe(II)-dependent formamide hydrolase-like protein